MKPDRKAKILELIGKYNISNQEELRSYLLKEGYNVTQGTVSKDMRALMLTKIQGTDGRLYYKAMSADIDMKRKYISILRDGFLSMTPAMNILVIKTASGMAMACAAAIDDFSIPEIIGCIAGDNTIFIATSSEKECEALMQEITKILEGD